MKEWHHFNLSLKSAKAITVRTASYHLGANPALEDTTPKTVDELRDDAAHVKHRDAVRAKAGENRLTEWEQDHA